MIIRSSERLQLVSNPLRVNFSIPVKFTRMVTQEIRYRITPWPQLRELHAGTKDATALLSQNRKRAKWGADEFS